MTYFPSSVASLTNPTATQLMNSPSHSTIESNQNNEVIAIETKLGVDGSVDTTTIDYKLKSTASIDPGHKHTVSSLSVSSVASSTTFLRGDGYWAPVGKFGGTGVDGSLALTTGTTTVNLGNAALYVKNYSSLSITGTGNLAFSNPNTNGTVVIFRVQGDVTLTGSNVPLIDLRSMGGAGGASASGAGTGGGGAGAIYIECGGNFNATGTIYAQGTAAVNNSGGTALGTSGGGAGGTIWIIYTTLTANSGTYTVTAGADNAAIGGGASSSAGVDGTDSKGIYGAFAGGTGGNAVASTTTSTNFGIPPTSSMLAVRYIPLMPGSGGGGSGGSSGGSPNGGKGTGIGGSGAGVSVVAKNEFFL